MNLLSNRPTSVSRLVWDSDLIPKGNYRIKGDLLGRLARNCFLTSDSSSGLKVGEFTGFTERFSGTAASPAVFEVDFSELLSAVETTDLSMVYYPDSDLSGISSSISFDAYTYGGGTPDYNQTLTLGGTVDYLDSLGNVLRSDTVSGSRTYYKGTNYSNGSTFVMTSIPFDLSGGVRKLLFRLTGNISHSSSYPRINFPTIPIYASGVSLL